MSPPQTTPPGTENVLAPRSSRDGSLEGVAMRPEVMYRSVYENAIEGIFQTTPEGRFLSANPALARMLGYRTPDELVATATDVGEQLCIEPARRLEFKQRLENERVVREFESRVYRKDGARIWVSING